MKRLMEEKQKFEWLTIEICKEYKAKADQLPENDGMDTGEWRRLREELQKRCNIQEIEAVNILRGRNISIYINKYDILSGRVPMPEKMRLKKEKAHKQKNEYDAKIDEYENRIAELESMTRSAGYGFEEKD